MKKIILIDGNSIVFRAFYATYHSSQIMQMRNGKYTNALFGFINMLLKLLTKEKFSHFLVLFDTGKKTFRNDFDENYKANRKAIPVELEEQFEYIYEFLNASGIKHDEKIGFEADDLIATYAKNFENRGYDVEIFSGDLDLIQLVTKNTKVNIFKKGVTDIYKYTLEKVEEEIGLSPNQYAEYLALTGDPSDNIKGVMGIGDKTAVTLLQRFNHLDEMYERLDEIESSKLKSNLFSSKESLYKDLFLATIKNDIDVLYNENDLLFKGIEKNEIISFLKKYELFSIVKKISTLDIKTPEAKKEEILTYKKITNDDDFKKIVKNKTFFYLELDNQNYHIANLYGVSIKDKNNNLYYLDNDYFLKSIEVKNYLEDGECKKIVYDYKKIIVFLNRYEIKINGVIDDLLLATYCVDPDLGQLELSKMLSAYGNYLVKLDNEVYKNIEKDDLFNTFDYSVHIVNKVEQISNVYEKVCLEVNKNNQERLLYDIEIPLSNVLAKLEIEGLFVDKKRLAEFEDEYTKRCNMLEEKIFSYSDKKFNLQSPKQMQDFLYEKLNITKPKKGKTGFSTSSETLEERLNEHEVISYIINYRKNSKILKTYINGIKELIHKDSKLHTIYTQTITKTGRLSSIFPNLQNLPSRNEAKEIREIFCVNNKNYNYISFDYSQIELRVLAAMSNSYILLEQFEKNNDIHLETAKRLFAKNNISYDERQVAKMVNFGIIYGITGYGLSNDLKVSVEKASEYIKKHRQNYPDVYKYLDSLVKFAFENGYATTILNRKRKIHNINSNDRSLIEAAKRLALNTPIQGSAADVIKIAMIKIDKFLEENKLKTKMLMQIHDELVFLVPKEEEKIICENIPKIMTNMKFLKVRLEVKKEQGKDLLYNA